MEERGKDNFFLGLIPTVTQFGTQVVVPDELSILHK